MHFIRPFQFAFFVRIYILRMAILIRNLFAVKIVVEKKEVNSTAKNFFLGGIYGRIKNT